jgi:DNA-binding response OmpR family regulator
MSSGSPDAKDSGGSRLGGARADFVASLGRKVQDARELVAALEDDPSSRPARDELRRKLHALGSGARLLRFEAMARSLAEALAVLERGAKTGALREADVVFVAQVIDDLPALAWGEVPPADAPDAPDPRGARGPGGKPHAPGEETDDSPSLPIAILVVGGEDLAEALTEGEAMRPRPFECERSDDAQIALELARAYAPDVVLVDADVPRAAELVEALLDDPLTEPVPIVVVGTFRASDEVARFVALGVAKALPKPVSPEQLRRTCDELLDAREGRTVRITLGEPTLEQLADRLSQELRRALVESVDRPALSCRVPLGEGTEVLGALWGAIARVQEIISQRTEGAIRFGGDAPEGTIALAPWLHHDVGAADRSGRGRGAAADVRLQGRRVVVADDDPGVTWFISDLLRTAGCEVHEALDGAQALDLAYQVQPELVVTDILMPKLDGFALSRALRRDVALRDVPVILLSWKEDLLQRVRELGASAAAYMRKESDSRAILARVREVLRPRARIEMRLRGDGEVRGRLDGLTPRLLLELVGIIRKDARIAVRDASYLYEIEVREGAPRKATRTGSSGDYASGERALASLLGVGSGRFVVSASHDPVRGELTGALADQLARPLSAARGAMAVTTGGRTLQVERIGVDEAALEEYLAATPEPARSLIRRVAAGESPRQMLLAGDVPPALFEDMVSDLAARGAIKSVVGEGGVDLLGPAVEAAAAVLRRAPRVSRSSPPNARASLRAPTLSARPAPSAASASAAPPVSLRPPASSSFESLRLSDPPPSSAPVVEVEEAVPSSLEDAVMRELSDRSPDPGSARVPTSNPPPIIEPSELRPRSSNPPAQPQTDATSEDRLLLPSIPPDAVVPETISNEEMAAAAADSPEPTEAAAPVAATEEPTDEPPKAEATHDTDVEGRYEALLAASTQPTRVEASASAAPPALDRTQPLPSRPPRVAEPAREEVEAEKAKEAPREPAPIVAPATDAAGAAGDERVESSAAPRGGSGWLGWVLLVGALAVIGGVAANTRRRVSPAAPPETPVTAVPSAAPSLAPVAPSPPPADATADLPPGADVPPGFGRIDVTAPASARIRVDGAIAGTGPALSAVAAPGTHEVRIEGEGHDSKTVIEVVAGKRTRVEPATTP